MRVGGNFYFDPKFGEPNPDLLLIAGGVGINPLYSIIRHVADICSDLNSEYTGKATLLFSAQNTDELLFKVHNTVKHTAVLVPQQLLKICNAMQAHLLPWDFVCNLTLACKCR